MSVVMPAQKIMAREINTELLALERELMLVVKIALIAHNRESVVEVIADKSAHKPSVKKNVLVVAFKKGKRGLVPGATGN